MLSHHKTCENECRTLANWDRDNRPRIDNIDKQ